MASNTRESAEAVKLIAEWAQKCGFAEGALNGLLIYLEPLLQHIESKGSITSDNHRVIEMREILNNIKGKNHQWNTAET